MRFEFAGTMTPSGTPGPGNPSNPPLLVLIYTDDTTLDAKHYADLGYTSAEIICIGGAGGAGGGYYIPSNKVGSTQYPGMKYYGGAGGGGGIHRVIANLLALPDSVDIKVGKGGAAGTWQDDPGLTGASPTGTEAMTTNTDGVDGGYSSFNDTTCRASGGKGGKRVQNVTWSGASVTPANDGGDGGIGGSITSGGGGAGGIQTRPGSSPSVQALPGSYDGTIGSGGGGGFGGAVNLAGRNTSNIETIGYEIYTGGDGAGGAFSVTDTSVYAPGSTAGEDPDVAQASGSNSLSVPGYGGGAKAAPVTGSSTEYGDSVQVPLNVPGGDGVVAILLSAK